MKHRYYYASSLITFIATLVVCGIYYSNRLFVFMLVEISLYIALMIKKDYIYYPRFSSICIGDKCVERHVLGFVHTSLPLADIHIVTFTANKSRFVVFSLEKLEHFWIGSVAELCRKHRAIMYPITERLKNDLPQLVGDKVSIHF